VNNEGNLDLNKEETRLREQLQRAVRSEEVPPYLETRIKAHINSSGSRGFAWKQQFASLAAAVLLVAGGAVAYQLGHLRLTASSQASYMASVSSRVATIMRVGLRDHIHCAYFRKWPKIPQTMEQFIQKLGPDYVGLIPIMQKEVPKQYRMEIAHQCTVGDRKFVHLVMRNEDQLLSLILSKKRQGESFETEGLLPALRESGIPLYQSGVQRFQIASFESRDYLVYFISDQPKEVNMQQMQAMAPAVKEYLKKLEL
jgi:hypothetical protein